MADAAKPLRRNSVIRVSTSCNRLDCVVDPGRYAAGAAAALDDIVAAYDLFANQRDGVLKIAIKPH